MIIATITFNKGGHLMKILMNYLTNNSLTQGEQFVI